MIFVKAFFNFLKRFLSSSVRSPHHLVPQSVEEYMIRAFYDLYIIIRFSDSQTSSFSESFASSVDGYQEIVATAFYIKRDFPIIIDDDRAHIEAMRGYRCDGYRVAMRYNNRSADAQ